LDLQKDRLSQAIEREKLFSKLSVLSNRILQIVKSHGQASISDLESITNANRNTIKVKLRELVAGGYLVKQGKGKGTWYTLGARSL